LYAAKTHLYHVTIMTRKLPVTGCPRKDRKAKGVDIGGTGEPHDPTNGGGDNQVGENEVPWTPTSHLWSDQDD
jgi:hypothetical protein